MKIRNGFVSNSSSSSFIIVGVELDQTQENCKSLCDKYLDVTEKELKSFTEKICCGKEMKSKFCPTCGKNIDDVEGTINYIELFRENQWDLDGLDVHSDEYSDGIIVGKSLSLDLEGDSQDVDTLIKEMSDTKKMVKDLGLNGTVKVHCGVSYG